MLVLLVSELIVLAVIGRYPFGGESRHQSIIFPFVLLSGFLLLDGSVSFLRFPLMKKLVLFFYGGLDDRQLLLLVAQVSENKSGAIYTRI